MSMYKEIIYEGKTYTFKASAGTDMLYKRMFGKDLDVVYKNIFDSVENVDPLKIIQLKKMVEEKKKTLSDEELKKDQEFINMGISLIKDQGAIELTMQMVNFVKTFAFITHLEATHEPREINKYLREEEFVAWLMEFDERFFRENVNIFRDIYQENIKQTSTLKNPDGRPTE